MTFTNRQKMQAAQREVNYRRWVYKKKVDDGKMAKSEAEAGIGIMEEIALDYGALAKADDEKTRLI